MNELKNEVRYFSKIQNESDAASSIIKEATDLAMASINRDFDYCGIKSTYSMSASEYAEKNDKVKKSWLAFAGENSGVKDFSDKNKLMHAFDNPTFVSLTNAIVAEAVLSVTTAVTPSQLLALANISEVDIGDSKTFNIETKGIPVAQRGSYTSNVTLLDSAATSGITVTPKVWTLGTSIDFIRILTNTFDFGKEIARVALGMLFAQYKLCASILFDSTNLTGTPLYQATFAAATYTKLISYLQALNNAGVQAYGTIPAYHAISALATTNYGFATQDEALRNGFLGTAFGIKNNVVDQATDLSAPFTTASADSLMLIPNDRVLLIADVGDKPVKLVRENYIRVITKAATDGSLNRMSYTYTQSFDAALITQAHYAIQGTTA